MHSRPISRKWAVWLLAAALAGCKSTIPGEVYPSSGALLPTTTLQLTETISYSLEQLLLVGATGWLVYKVYEPLAPNWELVEAKVAEGTYVLDLRMKRFPIGGAGEAMLVLKRRAEQLRQENGYGSYRVVDYYEGIESSTPVARRFAQGIVQLARAEAAR